jgi:hypothetical protein
LPTKSACRFEICLCLPALAYQRTSSPQQPHKGSVVQLAVWGSVCKLWRCRAMSLHYGLRAGCARRAQQQKRLAAREGTARAARRTWSARETSFAAPSRVGGEKPRVSVGKVEMDEFGDGVHEAQEENAAEDGESDGESDEELDGVSDEESDEESDGESGEESEEWDEVVRDAIAQLQAGTTVV